jgi:GT2 family glycosyltransferase
LDSVAPGVQTLPPWQYEVIVTDDGWPATAEGMIAERYSWAKWARGPRRGPAANRNDAARLGLGEWLAFTDDDCLPSPQWLAAFSAAIRPGYCIYEGRTTCITGCRSPLEHSPVNLTGGYLWSCNLLVAREAFEILGGFDERFPYPHMEDVDFRERARGAGYASLFVPEAVVDHPPRRLAAGHRLAGRHESWMYYWYKHGGRAPCSHRVLANLLRFRIKALFAHPFGVDTLRAVGSLAAEVATVVPRLPLWEWKHFRKGRSNAVARVGTGEHGTRHHLAPDHR